MCLHAQLDGDSKTDLMAFSPNYNSKHKAVSLLCRIDSRLNKTIIAQPFIIRFGCLLLVL